MQCPNSSDFMHLWVRWNETPTLRFMFSHISLQSSSELECQLQQNKLKYLKWLLNYYCCRCAWSGQQDVLRASGRRHRLDFQSWLHFSQLVMIRSTVCEGQSKVVCLLSWKCLSICLPRQKPMLIRAIRCIDYWQCMQMSVTGGGCLFFLECFIEPLLSRKLLWSMCCKLHSLIVWVHHARGFCYIMHSFKALNTHFFSLIRVNHFFSVIFICDIIKTEQAGFVSEDILTLAVRLVHSPRGFRYCAAYMEVMHSLICL